MKPLFPWLLGLSFVLAMPALAQTDSATQPDKTASLTKFDLDFPGGTPVQLVSAIEKATGRPLNAIIPPDESGIMLPPLKVTHVNVDQLFNALAMADMRAKRGPSGGYSNLTYGFSCNPGTGPLFGGKTDRTGTANDETIWYFRDERTVYPSVCRFFPLRAYLSEGLSVDDITTAIQTGWKMLGNENPPKLNFHKETSLLIAVGDPADLAMIDDVLQRLSPTGPKAKNGPAT